tara:strand:- start:384 stop:491 length:108 start_codon:yes stop_codon:yes gene_type:complete
VVVEVVMNLLTMDRLVVLVEVLVEAVDQLELLQEM